MFWIKLMFTGIMQTSESKKKGDLKWTPVIIKNVI